MRDLRKIIREVAADLLRERTFPAQFRILRFEGFHLLEPKVKILVAHGGDTVLVIKAASFFQLFL